MAKKHEWRRTQLPSGHSGGGIEIGFMAILIASVGIFLGFFLPHPAAPGILMPLSAALFSIGVLVLSVSKILREIRLMAFEAALRAGEVQTVDVKDPYIEHLNKAKP